MGNWVNVGLAIGALALGGALMGGAVWLGHAHALVLLTLGGVLLLLLVLFAFAAMMKLVGLSDRTQALGLPEGSVRAMIALALVALFAVLAAFAFQGNAEEYLPRQSAAAVATFQAQNSGLVGVVVRPDAGSDPQTYTIVIPGRPRALDEFTKSIMATVGTLMTAITAFYFGGRTAGAGQWEPTPPMQLRALEPTQHPVDRPQLQLRLSGAGLGGITRVQLRSGARLVEATGVLSSNTAVACDVAVSVERTPPGKWDVLALDAAGTAATLPQALEIAPTAGQAPPFAPTGITPVDHAIADGPFTLTVSGSALESVTRVVVRNDEDGTELDTQLNSSTAGKVKCRVGMVGRAAPGNYTIEIGAAEGKLVQAGKLTLR